MNMTSERDAISHRLTQFMWKLEDEEKQLSPAWNAASSFLEKLDTPTGLEEVLLNAKAFLERQQA